MILLIVLLAFFNRNPIEPYISGDTFRAASDYIYDETANTLNPRTMKKGDIIFVKTDYLAFFFRKYHSKIPVPYVLLTHNSDCGIPGSFARFLDDPKILAWFGQNVELLHPKLHPIPIGLANRHWGHGNVDLLHKLRSRDYDQSILLYMNFVVDNYASERSFVYDLFANAPYCTLKVSQPFESYLLDLAHAKFTLSPRGNGLDCHRTWEALWMGSIPIVKSSSLDSLYAGLPVLIVDDWSLINEAFLSLIYEKMGQMSFSSERMFFNYWLQVINSYR